MKIKITIILILFNIVSCFSQGIFSLSKDTINKMQIYLNMVKTADHYELISEMELQKISFLKAESRRYLDSASVLITRAEKSKKNALIILRKANKLKNRSSVLLQKADSIYIAASLFKDTADLKRSESDQYFTNLDADYRPVINENAFRFTTFIVLIETKDVRPKYLDDRADIKFIITATGDKEYIIGQFDTMNQAAKYSQSIARLGYADTSIKSLDVVY